jgi:hypothetical protein
VRSASFGSLENVNLLFKALLPPCVMTPGRAILGMSVVKCQWLTNPRSASFALVPNPPEWVSVAGKSNR